MERNGAIKISISRRESLTRIVSKWALGTCMRPLKLCQAHTQGAFAFKYSTRNGTFLIATGGHHKNQNCPRKKLPYSSLGLTEGEDALVVIRTRNNDRLQLHPSKHGKAEMRWWYYAKGEEVALDDDDEEQLRRILHINFWCTSRSQLHVSSSSNRVEFYYYYASALSSLDTDGSGLLLLHQLRPPFENIYFPMAPRTDKLSFCCNCIRKIRNANPSVDGHQTRPSRRCPKQLASLDDGAHRELCNQSRLAL